MRKSFEKLIVICLLIGTFVFLCGIDACEKRHSISGTVGGDIQKGITITLSGNTLDNTKTDSEGNYKFWLLENDRSYTITPSLDGYVFSPSSQDILLFENNEENINFTSIEVGPGFYTISGTVSGDIQEGVTVILSGNENRTTQTSSDGSYSFPGLENGTYTVTPSHLNYTFSQISQSVIVNNEDTLSMNFDSIQLKIWEFETGGEVYSSPAVSDGYVYVGSDDGYIYCLNAKTGSKVWDFDTEGISVSSSPVVSNGHVYVGRVKKRDFIVSYNNYGKLYCLNSDTGELVWEFDTENRPYTNSHDFYSSPAVSNGYVYAGSSYYKGGAPDGKLYCLDSLTGVVVWAGLVNGSIKSAPAVSDGYVYVGTLICHLYCFDEITGEKIVSTNLKDNACTAIYSSPAVSDGYVYIGNIDNKVHCLDALTGSKVWEFETEGKVYSSPAVSDGYIYIGSYDNKIYCLNALTGSKVWEFEAEDSINSSPAVSNGYVYVGSDDNKVYCLNSATGDTGSWPMFRYNNARTGAK